MRRKLLMSGALVGALAIGGLVGAALGAPVLSGASSSKTPTTSSSAPAAPAPRFDATMGADKAVLDAAAKALGLSTTQLLQKLSDGKTTIADVAGQQHVTVQKVVDAMTAVAKASISDLVNKPLPQMRHGSGPGHFDGPKGGFGFGGRGGGASFDAVAKALGVSTQTLLSDLRNGQSIAAIAKAKHVDVSKLIDTLTSDAQAKIDAAVKAGHLSKAQAKTLSTNLRQRITDLVNGTRPSPQFGGRGHFGFGGGGGWSEHGGMPGPPSGAPKSAPTSIGA